MDQSVAVAERHHALQLAIIDAIYAAATEPERWHEVVTTFSALVGGSRTSIVRRTAGQGDLYIATTLDPDFVRTYEEYYAPLNPWTARTVGSHATLQVNDDVVSGKEVERSEFYADWMRPQGVRFPICTHVPLGGGESINFVSLRAQRLGEFERRECEIVLALRPHLLRAAEVSRRLSLSEAGRATVGRSIRGLGAGLILVDASRKVRFIDEGAERVVRDGGGLSVQFGQLRAPTGFDATLGEALDRATGSGRAVGGRSGTLLTLPRHDGRAPLSVAVSPVDERDRPWGMSGPLAMILVTDPERVRRPTEGGLRTLFDLTSAEAKLVVALCGGQTLASYAAQAGVSPNTVKTHLKHVFDKTGETRQADLVRRIATDMALQLELGREV